MRNIYTLFIALLVVGLMACEKDISSPKQVRIGLKKCEQVSDGKETVRLCFDTVLQESRCPINAICVWQGVAITKFTLHLNDVTYTLELATNNILPNTTTDTTIQGYTITLKNISPYPGEAVDGTPYADLLVKRY